MALWHVSQIHQSLGEEGGLPLGVCHSASVTMSGLGVQSFLGGAAVVPPVRGPLSLSYPPAAGLPACCVVCEVRSESTSDGHI